MAVPDYQSFMLPVLLILSGGGTFSSRELRARAADDLGLGEEDRRELLPSGKQTVLANRVGWAVTYLVKAGVVERPVRGRVQITERGRELLAENPSGVGVRTLDRFPEFSRWRAESAASAARVVSPGGGGGEEVSLLTPSERIQEIVRAVDAGVAAELLGRVYEAGSGFLEDLSVQLLRAMGYGGPQWLSQVTPRGGDAGLDGIIHQDALGLDLVGVQAKCYSPESSIHRPEIQAFVGALQGAQTQRGVFVTTAKFSAGAKEYADSVSVRLVLIDGDVLVRSMMRHNLGVAVHETYEIKQIDEDFFDR